MRVHFSSVVAVFVTLLFVSGTVGCQSNGGNWYNPKTYSWSNPFSKGNQASHAQANTRPSLGAHPNISDIPGGYSDSSFAQQSGTVSATPPDHWEQRSPMSAQSTTHSLGGFSVAEPSSFPPSYAMGQQHHGTSHPGAMGGAPLPQQQQSDFMPFGHSDYMQTGFHAPHAVDPHQHMHHQQQQQHVQHSFADQHHAGMSHQMPSGNYAPFGAAQHQVTHHHDPHMIQQQHAFPQQQHHAFPQQSAAPPMGFGHDPMAPVPHASQGMPMAAPHHQPQQPFGGHPW